MSKTADLYIEMQETHNWDDADKYYENQKHQKDLEQNIYKETEYGTVTDLDKLRTAIKDKAQWHRTKDGEVIHITKLDDNHLKNLIRWYENKKAIMYDNFPPDIDTHAWDDYDQCSLTFTPLKDASLGNMIKYDMLIEELNSREPKETEVE